MKGKYLILMSFLTTLILCISLITPVLSIVNPPMTLQTNTNILIDCGETKYSKPKGYEEHITLREYPYPPSDYDPSILIREEPYTEEELAQFRTPVETEPITYYWNDLSYYDVIVNKHPVLVECADWELYELYCLAYLEAGSYTQSDDCIRAVVEAVFNQLNNGSWGSTLHDVIYATNNYEPAQYISTTTPSQRCIDIVNDVYYNGISLPSRIMFFRAEYYHQWYGAIPEFNIEGVYFSSSIWHQD